jgi:hypothetical protein
LVGSGKRLIFAPQLTPHSLAFLGVWFRPVVLDAAYLPAETLLLAQAQAAGCPCVRGVDMLIRQGLAQARLFTQRRPAEQIVTRVVQSHYCAMVSRQPPRIDDLPLPMELGEPQ